ncbi:hypothetical protein BBJ28_00003594 [Nothophytophthora sp. Chile5]|nr:hypothetical protein BBJ28_00003594 [Nothophytophthora sp. Chile5]
MMMMHGSAPQQRAYQQADEGTETISISIGLGSDGRSSSIVLPRGHDLVRHLERLIPAITPAPQQPASAAMTAPALVYTQPARRPDVARYDAVHALSSLPYQQPAPISSLSQYVRANSRYETSASPVSAPLSPLYHSDSSTTAGRVYHHSQEHLEVAGGARMTRTRRRRGANGTSGSGKRCQFAGCDKISVSRGLCRGHGGGRRCQHEGCAKGAQSRSDFCWAHGGGQRCEVKNCMRSRKSKRFCVAHLSWEDAAPTSPSVTEPRARVAYAAMPRKVVELPKTILPKAVSPLAQEATSPSLLAGNARLPSLLQALRNTQQSSSMTVRS